MVHILIVSHLIQLIVSSIYITIDYLFWWPTNQTPGEWKWVVCGMETNTQSFKECILYILCFYFIEFWNYTTEIFQQYVTHADC